MECAKISTRPAEWSVYVDFVITEDKSDGELKLVGCLFIAASSSRFSWIYSKTNRSFNVRKPEGKQSWMSRLLHAGPGPHLTHGDGPGYKTVVGATLCCHSGGRANSR